MANGISSFVLAVMAPWLGALADKGSAHVRFLAAFTAIGVIPTALLAFVGPADWVTRRRLFAIASLGFWGGLIFYDSMLMRVAPPRPHRFGVGLRLFARAIWAAGCC